MLRTLKSERGGEPDEFHAFLFGIGDFTLRARHVFPVAAIEALDRLRPLPDRRANAVHRSVAAADHDDILVLGVQARSEEHTSELQSLMRISYAVFCLKKNKYQLTTPYQE